MKSPWENIAVEPVNRSAPLFLEYFYPTKDSKFKDDFEIFRTHNYYQQGGIFANYLSKDANDDASNARVPDVKMMEDIHKLVGEAKYGVIADDLNHTEHSELYDALLARLCALVYADRTQPFNPDRPKWQQVCAFPFLHLMLNLCAQRDITPEDEIRSLMDDESKEWNEGGRHHGLKAARQTKDEVGDNVELLAILCKAAWMSKHGDAPYTVWPSDKNKQLCEKLQVWSKSGNHGYKDKGATGVHMELHVPGPTTPSNDIFVPFVCSSDPKNTSAYTRLEWKDIVGEEIQLPSVFSIAPERKHMKKTTRQVEQITDFKECITEVLNDAPRNSRLLYGAEEMRPWEVTNVPKPPSDKRVKMGDPEQQAAQTLYGMNSSQPMVLEAKKRKGESNAEGSGRGSSAGAVVDEAASGGDDTNQEKTKKPLTCNELEDTLRQAYQDRGQNLCLIVVPDDSKNEKILISQCEVKYFKVVVGQVESPLDDRRVVVITQTDFVNKLSNTGFVPDGITGTVDVLLPSLRSLLNDSGDVKADLLDALRRLRTNVESPQPATHVNGRRMRVCLMEATHPTKPWSECKKTDVVAFDDMVRQSSDALAEFKKYIQTDENLDMFANDYDRQGQATPRLKNLFRNHVESRFKKFNAVEPSSPSQSGAGSDRERTYLHLDKMLMSQRANTNPNSGPLLPINFFDTYFMRPASSTDAEGMGDFGVFYKQDPSTLPARKPRTQGPSSSLQARLRNWYITDHSEILALGGPKRDAKKPSIFKQTFLNLFYKLCDIFEVTPNVSGQLNPGGYKAGATRSNDARQETTAGQVTLVHPLITPSTYEFTRSMLGATKGMVPCAVASYTSHFVHDKTSMPFLNTFVSDEDMIRHVFMRETENHVLIM